MSNSDELVVLADSTGTPTGTAPKATVHTADTPYHLAFSCYVYNATGEILLTRRALSKLTWPGVWTNSMCGHPGVDEPNEAAVRRRGEQELGISQLEDVEVILPEFSYRAVDSSGIVEWEFCPVFRARLASDLYPTSSEVDSYSWLAPEKLFAAVDAAPFAFSPWMVEQLADPTLRQALNRSQG